MLIQSQAMSGGVLERMVGRGRAWDVRGGPARAERREKVRRGVSMVLRSEAVKRWRVLRVERRREGGGGTCWERRSVGGEGLEGRGGRTLAEWRALCWCRRTRRMGRMKSMVKKEGILSSGTCKRV